METPDGGLPQRVENAQQEPPYSDLRSARLDALSGRFRVLFRGHQPAAANIESVRCVFGEKFRKTRNLVSSSNVGNVGTYIAGWGVSETIPAAVSLHNEK